MHASRMHYHLDGSDSSVPAENSGEENFRGNPARVSGYCLLSFGRFCSRVKKVSDAGLMTNSLGACFALRWIGVVSE